MVEEVGGRVKVGELEGMVAGLAKGGGEVEAGTVKGSVEGLE